MGAGAEVGDALGHLGVRVADPEVAHPLLQRLGAVTASGLDAGGSTTMAFDGQLLNRPSDRPGERSVAEALLVSYTGVYVPPASAPVFSPNRDGVSDVETLSYKVVRPSTVSASLVGPDDVTVPIDAGQRAPGTYKFNWPGTAAPEGSWRFVVNATDDLVQVSTADRAFALNNTLSKLAVRPKALKLRKKRTRLLASFTAGAVRESDRHGGDGDGHRRTRPLARLGRRRNAPAHVERPQRLGRHRVHRFVPAPRLGDERLRPRRPVRAVHGT